MVLLGTSVSASAQQERALGIDVSAWQANILQTTWNNIRNVENRQFVFIRSSRGGTTGYYNQSDPNNNNNLNTLSQRYDDPYFVQNIDRATTAGILAGSYHFSRPDIIETTQNSGGIANNGADEADHMIQMAGAWMRPGYLLPVHDLEAGINQRQPTPLATFSIDFSNRIFEVMGIRPIMYINGAYANHVQSASNRATLVSAYPVLWSARYANQSDPNSIPIQTGHPKDTYTPIYGPWDDAPNPTHPWGLWQYASTLRLQSYNNGGNNLDANVAQGGTEFIKDILVPAIWMNNSSGQWTTQTNWNSGQAPVAPVQGPGQVARVGSLILPATRLPTLHDTVILDRPAANITVTLSSGTHNIRKLYVRETLSITGGTLNVNYVPSWDSTPISAQFSGAVTLGGSGTLSVHTLQVDASRTFTLGGGNLLFNTMKLMPHNSSPGKIAMTGNVNFDAVTSGNLIITNGAGLGISGTIDLVGGNRTFNVANGVNLSVEVPVSNGALVKAGTGTMLLNKANTYSGGTTLSAGTLLVNNTSGSGTGSGNLTINGGILGGTGSIAGAVTVNGGGTIRPGTATSIGNLTLNSAPTLNGTVSIKINRNGGSTLADKVTRPTGTLNYGGTLAVSNIGAALVGGEVFTIFSAGAYTGAFSVTQLPALSSGLNWYLGDLAVNGTIRVNRNPVAGLVTFTNVPVQGLEIPVASLIAAGTDADGDPISLSGFDPVTTNGVTLTVDVESIIYSNNSNVADQFDYTISDGRGGSATGMVRILPSPDGYFTLSPTVDSNDVTLHFSGEPGATYYLERSTNLSAWQTISTNVVPSSGLFDYIDNFEELAETPSAAYYRLRWSP